MCEMHEEKVSNMGKITETIERECCHPTKDLKKYSGVHMYGFKKLWFCQHCGQLHHHIRRAGEMDAGFEPVSNEDMKQ